MTTLVPPPIRTPMELPNGAMHPVWARWFIDLYARAGGSIATPIDDVELVANLARQDDHAQDESRITALEGLQRAYPDVSDIESRVTALEAALTSQRGLQDLGYSERWHDFTPGSAPAYRKGRLFYDGDDNTLSYFGEFQGTELNIGEEIWIRVRNQSGATITDGQVVKLVGATGQTPLIELARADTDDKEVVIAVTTMEIPNNGFGVVTSFGVVRGLNTSAFSDGDVVYLSESTAGGMTTTVPSTPNHKVAVGRVLYANPSVGRLFVRIESAEDLTAHEQDTDAHGIKHARVTTGSIGAGASALVTVTWGTAYADANYTVQASVQDSTASASSLRVVHVETRSATQVQVRVENTSLGSLTGTLHVTAIHD